jgi:hypothetical protein
LVALHTFVTFAALAATPSNEAFKSLYEQGESLFEKKDWGGAVYAFRRADALKATPEVAFDLAKCNQKLGEDALATYYFRLYLRRAPQARDALGVAGEVADVLNRAESEGRGLLEVEATAAAEATLAGHHYPELPMAVFLPPGDYDVAVQFRSATVHRVGALSTGRAVTLKVEPPPSLPPPPAAAFAVERSEPPRPRATLHTASYGLFALAGAALVAGSVAGLMGNIDTNQIQTSGPMSSSQRNALTRSAQDKGTAANVLWGAAGGAALAGGVMFAFTLPEPGGS